MMPNHNVHNLVFICIVLGPTLLVLLFSYIVSLLKVKGNPMEMINQTEKIKKGRKQRKKMTFIKELDTLISITAKCILIAILRNNYDLLLSRCCT
jgi:hypothetical protein